MRDYTVLEETTTIKSASIVQSQINNGTSFKSLQKLNRFISVS